jgi:hypothetical protein
MPPTLKMELRVAIRRDALVGFHPISGCHALWWEGLDRTFPAECSATSALGHHDERRHTCWSPAREARR